MSTLLVTPAEAPGATTEPWPYLMRDGTPVELVPLRPGDESHVDRFFADLSETSRYQRFMSPIPRIHAGLIRALCATDGEDHFAWMAWRGGAVAGIGRFVRLRENPAIAEFAMTVADALQGRGLGRLLLQALATVAIDRGIQRFAFSALAGNRPVLALARACGGSFAIRGGVAEGEFPVRAAAGGFPADPGILRAVGEAVGLRSAA